MFTLLSVIEQSAYTVTRSCCSIKLSKVFTAFALTILLRHQIVFMHRICMCVSSKWRQRLWGYAVWWSAKCVDERKCVWKQTEIATSIHAVSTSEGCWISQHSNLCQLPRTSQEKTDAECFKTWWLGFKGRFEPICLYMEFGSKLKHPKETLRWQNSLWCHI